MTSPTESHDSPADVDEAGNALAIKFCCINTTTKMLHTRNIEDIISIF